MNIGKKQSSQVLLASNITNVPFLDKPITFECDASGKTFTISSHGITIQVPQGAVPKGETIQFEVAVTLIGPFKFSMGKRPISPILWLCTQEDITFEKPIQIKMPHFLIGLSEEEKGKFKVNFAKGDHPDIGSSEASLPQVEFKPCQSKVQLIVNENGSYGILHTSHCCFFCMEAEHSSDLAMRAGYCLTRVEYQPSPSVQAIHFCATFQLDTCLDVSG